MIRSAGRWGVAGLVVWACMAYSALAGAQNINFRDVEIARPYHDSVVVVGSNSRASAGIEVRELQKAMDQVRDQARALDELKNQNRELQRKVDDQGRKIALLERNQSDSNRNGSSSNATERQIAALERQVNQLSRDLDRLSSKVK